MSRDSNSAPSDIRTLKDVSQPDKQCPHIYHRVLTSILDTLKQIPVLLCNKHFFSSVSRREISSSHACRYNSQAKAAFWQPNSLTARQHTPNSLPEKSSSLPQCKELHGTLAAPSLFVSTEIKVGGTLAIRHLNSVEPTKLQHRTSPPPSPQLQEKPCQLQQAGLHRPGHVIACPCAASLESTIQ